MQKRTKRVVLIIVVALAVPMVAFGAKIGWFLLGQSVATYEHATRFDSAAWKARSMDTDPGWPTRLRMVDDLLARKVLNGLARTQVEEVLGPADDTEYFREWDLVYKLGPERGSIRIDSEWLVLRFDKAGRIAQYHLVRD